MPGPGPESELQLRAAIIVGHSMEIVEQVVRRLPANPNLAIMNDPAQSSGGLGVGLNLVRRIVELHGGTVRASSDGGTKGSTFTVEIPLANEGS